MRFPHIPIPDPRPGLRQVAGGWPLLDAQDPIGRKIDRFNDFLMGNGTAVGMTGPGGPNPSSWRLLGRAFNNELIEKMLQQRPGSYEDALANLLDEAGNNQNLQFLKQHLSEDISADYDAASNPQFGDIPFPMPETSMVRALRNAPNVVRGKATHREVVQNRVAGGFPEKDIAMRKLYRQMGLMDDNSMTMRMPLPLPNRRERRSGR